MHKQAPSTIDTRRSTKHSLTPPVDVASLSQFGSPQNLQRVRAVRVLRIKT